MRLKKKKLPFSKLVIGYVIVLCSLFLIFVCYEIHRLCDLTALAYIGTSIVGLMASSLGFYVWRARKTDDYELALQKTLKEKEIEARIETDQNIMM